MSPAVFGSSSTRVSGGEISISWPSTPPIALEAAAIIWLAASATAESSSSDSAASAGSSEGGMPIACASLRAPAGGSTKMFAPVTPST